MFDNYDGKNIFHFNELRQTINNKYISIEPRLFIYEYNKNFENKKHIHVNYEPIYE